MKLSMHPEREPTAEGTQTVAAYHSLQLRQECPALWLMVRPWGGFQENEFAGPEHVESHDESLTAFHLHGRRGRASLITDDTSGTEEPSNVLQSNRRKGKQQLCGTCDCMPATQGMSYIMIDKPKHRLNWRRRASQASQLLQHFPHKLSHSLAALHLFFPPLVCCYTTHKKLFIIRLHHRTYKVAGATRGEQLAPLPVQIVPPSLLASIPSRQLCSRV